MSSLALENSDLEPFPAPRAHPGQVNDVHLSLNSPSVLALSAEEDCPHVATTSNAKSGFIPAVG